MTEEGRPATYCTLQASLGKAMPSRAWPEVSAGRAPASAEVPMRSLPPRPTSASWATIAPACDGRTARNTASMPPSVVAAVCRAVPMAPGVAFTTSSTTTVPSSSSNLARNAAAARRMLSSPSARERTRRAPRDIAYSAAATPSSSGASAKLALPGGGGSSPRLRASTGIGSDWREYSASTSARPSGPTTKSAPLATAWS